MIDFRIRANEAELMDAHDCDPVLLRRTLEQFKHSNRLFTRYRALLTRWVLDDMALEPDRERTLLDLGCGAGDIPIWLATQAGKLGLPLIIVTVDSHPEVVAFARERLKPFPTIRCRQGDALELDRWMPVDYVFGNHFLHHLPDRDIVLLLKRLCNRPVRCFVFDDLLRSRMSWGTFAMLASILFRESFACHDGLVSIRRGFRPGELRQLLHDGGLHAHVRVIRMWPRRVVLIGRGQNA